MTSPKDCTDIYNSNTQSPSGHYQVLLPIFGHVTVFCDMAIDGGGWTVVYEVIALNVSFMVDNLLKV